MAISAALKRRNRQPPDEEEHFIVRVDRFIRATRDSGYKGTGSAVSELVDNALQAKARTIDIWITKNELDSEDPIRVSVTDDGIGMDADTLRQALRFGGSTRFEDRSGLGRYGMGLPNSSLSQGRRVEVYTWQKPGAVISSYLDVDEIAGRSLTLVPEPQRATLPATGAPRSSSGTVVVWSKCDRLDNRRVSTLARKLAHFLGRVFRHYIWAGVAIRVNGEAVTAIDPLFLHPQSLITGARVFGEVLTYEVENQEGPGAREVGTVTVTFTELPIHDWHGLSNKEKRHRGISKGAGVSIVRAGREIDYGFWFMGGKRKENYDDWWRCEVKFDPVLDEAFGITHTKQGIRPRDYLIDVLTPDLEAAARALNSRARRAHMSIKNRQQASVAEQVAEGVEQKLPPLKKPAASIEDSLAQLARELPALRPVAEAEPVDGVAYTISTQRRRSTTAIYDFVFRDGKFILLLNEEHPFYRRLFSPLVDSDSDDDRLLGQQLQLTLLAAARAEATCTLAAERATLKTFRNRWSEALGLLLNARAKR